MPPLITADPWPLYSVTSPVDSRIISIVGEEVMKMMRPHLWHAFFALTVELETPSNEENVSFSALAHDSLYTGDTRNALPKHTRGLV